MKGRAEGTGTVTITKNEIFTALNMPGQFALAVVEVNGTARAPRYIRRPFRQEPNFGATSVTYDLRELLARGEAPS